MGKGEGQRDDQAFSGHELSRRRQAESVPPLGTQAAPPCPGVPGPPRHLGAARGEVPQRPVVPRRLVARGVGAEGANLLDVVHEAAHEPRRDDEQEGGGGDEEPLEIKGAAAARGGEERRERGTGRDGRG